MGILDIFKRGAPLPTEPKYSVFGWFNLIRTAQEKTLATKDEQLGAYAGWVYAAVRRIVEDLRSVGWRFMDADGRTFEDARLMALFTRPFTLMTFGDLIERFWVHHDLTGEAYLYTVTNPRGDLIGLQPVSPAAVQEPIIEDGVFKGWRVLRGAEVFDIPVRELIRSHYQHPKNEFLAASPVEAFAASFELDLYARAYGASMVKNKSGIPPLILSTDQVLTTDIADVIREEWRQRHAERYGEQGPAVLGAGVKAQVVGIPLSDLRFLEIAQVSRDQILAIYGVPASKLGLVEDVNRANAEANDRTYRQNVLAPRVRRFEEIINTYVIAEFFPQLYRRGIRFRFDDPVGVDPNLRFQKVLHGWRTGAVTRNEYRQEAGLEPLPNDVLAVPLGVSEVPVSVEARLAQRALEPTEKAKANRHTEKDLELAALRFARYQEPAERRVKAQVRSLFSREQKEVLAYLRERLGRRSPEDEDLLTEFENAIRAILERLRPRWVDTFERMFIKAIFAGWQLAFDESALEWPIVESDAVEWARKNAGTRIVDIQETTLQEIRRVLEQGLMEGWNIREFTDAVGELYDAWKGYRAERIARTETGTALNWGKFKHAQEMERITGRKVYKVWSSILDQRTREDHVAAHGQRKPLHEPYEVGGYLLMHPLDPNGPASEVINCRCTEYYEVEGEE